MRFADHDPLLEPSDHVKVYSLDARTGFESFYDTGLQYRNC